MKQGLNWEKRNRSATAQRQGTLDFRDPIADAATRFLEQHDGKKPQHKTNKHPSLSRKQRLKLQRKANKLAGAERQRRMRETVWPDDGLKPPWEE